MPGKDTNRRLIFAIAIFALVLFAASGRVAHSAVYRQASIPTLQEEKGDQGMVLILYDSSGEQGDYGSLFCTQLRNLLGHFGCHVVTKPVESYRSSDLRGVMTLFYLGVAYDNRLPVQFLRDVTQAKLTICWIGYNLWQLDDLPDLSATFAKRYQFQYQHNANDSQDYSSVTYTQTTLRRVANDQGLGVVTVLNKDEVTVYATCSNGTDTVPYIVRGHNFWYVADNPFLEVTLADRYLAFADVLHDILGIEHPTKHYAYVRIEDVSPMSDPGALRRIADLLAEKEIPFGVCVIPVYQDLLGVYNDGNPVYRDLPSTQAFEDALHYMVAKGGQIILHGFTHQYNGVRNPYTGVTGEDFEFFMVEKDDAGDIRMLGPVAEDSAEWSGKRLDAACAALSMSDLKAVAWNTPHYLASQLDYAVFAKYFAYSVDRGLYFSASGKLYQQQMAPYLLRDYYGTIHVPETLGFVTPVQPPDPAEIPLRERAMANLVVRDGWAGCYYHWDQDVQYLEESVAMLNDMGYYFVRIPD